MTQMPQKNFHSHYPRRRHIKFGFELGVLEKKMFEIVDDDDDGDGLTPEHGYTIAEGS